MRTQEEINYQVQGILEEKETTPEFNFWGQNDWKKADAQVAVLLGTKKADDFEDGEDYDIDAYRAAAKAEEWLNSVEPDNLFEEC